MSWLLYAGGATVIWAFVSLLDKFIVDREIENPVIDGAVNMVAILVILFAIGLVKGSLDTSIPVAVKSGLAGFLFVAAVTAYFWGVEKEDVSRFAPVLSMDAVFLLVLSAFFLGEIFTPVIYAGAALTIAGAFLISLENPVESLERFESRDGFLLALLSASLYAFRELLLKSALANASRWTIVLWMSMGGLLVSLFLLAAKFREVKKQDFSGLEHLTLAGVLMAAGFLLFLHAISIGPVSLVSTVTKTRFLLIFLASVTLSSYRPGIIQEELGRKVLLQKAAATLMIIIGVSTIALY